MQGKETTVAVTMEQMLYHAALVTSGVERALVVGDLPFMSYQVNPDEALRNAGRMVKESGVEAVKLEGGEVICETVRRIVDVGIPVMGHLGLTPQSIHKFGTYQVRATTPEEARQATLDARSLQDAGAFAIVLEKVPAALAESISRSLTIPVIGIGAGGGVRRADPRHARHARALHALSSAFRAALRRARDRHARCVPSLRRRREER